jgi:hypothetical protein
VQLGIPVAHGLFGIKFMVVTTPHLSARLVLRGARLDEPGMITFTSNGSEGLIRRQILHLRTGAHWGKYPDLMYVHSSGCYAVRLDTPERTEVIIFVAH